MKRLFMNRPMAREVLDCGSPLPLSIAGSRSKVAEVCRTPRRKRGSPAAFSLTELLVVMAILALLAATQLPALSRGKAPVKFTQCMNNLRQIGQATMLYLPDNNDCYPFGNRVSLYNATDLYGWPMQLSRYLGGYKPNVHPTAYICPSVVDPPDPAWAFQLHYLANRSLLSDTDDRDTAIHGAQVRKPAIYWMFIERGPSDYYASTRSAGLATALSIWNYPPGSPAYRRHSGGMTSAAIDGHVEWLRTPPYLADSHTAPLNFVELGDCAEGINPATTWTRDNPHNGLRVKLWSRYNQRGF